MKKKITFLGILILLLLVGGIPVWLLQKNRTESNLSFLEEPTSPPRFMFNIYGKGESKEKLLNGPLGVAVGKNGIYVTDSEQGRVQVFSSKGKHLFSFPADPSFYLKEQMPGEKKAYPVGIVIDNKGNLLVTEIRQGKIWVFNEEGKYLYPFPWDEEQAKLLIKPLAIAAANDRIYLTDIGDQTIKIFSRKGDLLQKFGQFSFPGGIAVAEDGRIYVADSNQSQIQVFDSRGKFLFFIKEKGLVLPRGLAFDGLERLHTVDALTHRVFVFDKKGKHLFTYGQAEEMDEEGSLNLPNGIAIDKMRRWIYLTDRENDRIAVWQY